jgi:hypothetical protein
MPTPARSRCAILAATAFAAACATAPAPLEFERRLDLPADIAAAVAAGAMRSLLPFADPVPQAAGAPGSRAGNGDYTVLYEQGSDGDWVPRASHRLTVIGADDGGRIPRVAAEPLHGNLALPGWGSGAAARLQVHVRGDGKTCAVRAQLPTAIAAAAAQALDRAFALALDPDAQRVGLAEPNLAALVSRREVEDAQHLLAAGEPSRAEAALLRAARLAAVAATRYRQLGELAAQHGDLALARERLGEALLRAADPLLRAQLAARLGALARAPAAPSRSVLGPTAPAQRATLAAQLHTARRAQPEPARDYQLASQLHRQNADELAALACALLAREHGATTAVAANHHEPLRRGLDDFLRRLALGVEPVIAAAPAGAAGP